MAKAKAKAKRIASRGAKSSAKTKGKAKSKSNGRAATKSKAAPKGPVARKGTAKKTAAGRAAAKRRRPSPRTRLPHVGERGSGKGTIGKSGEGLDGGVARHEAGDPGAIGTRPTATRRPEPRKAKAQLSGEKAIADTDRTVPLRPERPSPGEREPMPPAALDQRRQIVGTDDPRDADDLRDAEDAGASDDFDEPGDADAP